MSRSASFVAFLALAAWACGGGGAPVLRPDTPPRTVLLLQVDGLSPTLLEQYLRRPTSRAADRALHDILGASPPGAGPLHYQRAVSTTALAPLGTDGVAAGVTLLTGKNPAEHGAGQGPVAAEIPFVFEQLNGRAGAVAGLPARGPGLVAIEAATDAEHVEALLARLPAEPGLVAVRFTGVAQASADGAASALADIDRQVARLRAKLSPATLVVLTAGFGGVRHKDTMRGIDLTKLAEFLVTSREDLRGGGGALWVTRLGEDTKTNLLGLEGLAATLLHDGNRVIVLDREVGDLRPLLPGEFPEWPDFEARVRASVPANTPLVIAQRDDGVDFGPEGDVRRGGPARDESEIPLIFAGPMLAGASPAALEGMALTEVAATVRGALLDGADGRWPALRKKTAEAPAASPPFIQALGGPANVPEGLAAGARAFQAGRFPEAVASLGALTGLTGEAETWRLVLHGWALRKVGTGDVPAPAWPAATGPAGRALAIARLDVGEEDAPPLPAGEGPLGEAFGVLYAAPGHPCRPPEASQRDRLTRAAATFTEAGLPGFAARAEAARSKILLQSEEIRDAHRATLRLVMADEAGHMRASVLQDLLLTSVLRPDIAAAADAELTRAAELQLLHMQAIMAADTAPGAEDRRVGLLAGLIDGVAVQRQPALVKETVDQAVRGQGDVAAAVVRSLVGFGGLAALFRGDLVRSLAIAQEIMDQALAEVVQKPVDQLTADEKVARAVPLLIAATLKTLQGQGARGDVTQALELLPQDGTLADRTAALAKAGPTGTPTLAAWAPFVRGVALLAAGVLDLMAENPDAATEQGLALVELARRVTQAELSRNQIKGLDAHIDALAQVLVAALHWAAAESKGDGSAGAKATALRAAVAKVPLEAPDADPAARPWLSLVGVMLHDLAWATGPRAPADLAAPQAALEKLVSTWRPESRLGQAGLLGLLAVQHTLLDIENFKEVEGLDATLAKLPRLKEALARVRAEVRTLYPEADLATQLKADKVERVVLENLILLLEIEPAQWVDTAALLRAIEARNQAMYALVQEAAGDSRDVLTLLLAFIESQRDLPAAAARVAQAAGRPAGPAFEGYGVIWHGLEARFRALAGDPKAADQAAARAQAACGPLAWRLGVARGVWLMQSRDPAAAQAQFRAAREGSRRAGHGGYGARFNLAVQDGQSLVNAVIQVPMLGVLLGRASGTFQLGAGGTSIEKQHRTVNWQFVPEGTATDAALEAQALEGWMALVAGDQATAGKALSQIVALLFGADPRHLDDLPADGLPPHTNAFPLPRSPELLVWLAVLADLHGHERLGDWVLVQMAHHANSEWTDPPGGTETTCADDLVEKGPGEAAPIVQRMFCQAPAPLARLLKGEAAAAFAQVVEAHLRARSGEKVDKKPAVARLRRLAPGLFGGRGPGLKPGKIDPGAVKAAVRAGYACELGLLATERPELAPLVATQLQGCGLAPFRAAVALSLPADGVDPDTRLKTLEGALEIAARLPGVRYQLFLFGWKEVIAVVARPDQRGQLLARSRHWATVADTLDAPDSALVFRALGLTQSSGPAQIEQAQALLRTAWEKKLAPSPATRYLKRLALGQDPRAAATEFLQ